MSSEPQHDLAHAAQRWFGRTAESLGEAETRVLRRTAKRQTIARDLNVAFDDKQSFGDRLADQVARFGGSWTFISIFGIVLAIWTTGNALLGRGAFDPYPFIFLNLMLSMLAAVQAPIIMMSQNRQSAKDRMDAGHDYEVNLKSEIEIMALHDKLDQLRAEQLAQLLKRQDEQIALLTRLLEEKSR